MDLNQNELTAGTTESTVSHVTFLLKRGYDALRSDQLDSAEKEFLDVLLHHPQNIEALKGASICYLRQGKRRTAIDYLKTYVELNPRNTKYTLILAGMLVKETGPADAVNVCLRCLDSINDKAVHNRLLKSLVALSTDHQLAVLQLLVDSGHATADEYSSLAKLQIGQKNLDQAHLILSDGVKNYPDSVKLLSLLAKLNLEARNFKEVYSISSHLMQIKPANPVYRYYLYRAAYELERYEEAFHVIEFLRQEVPNDYRYILGVGLCLYQLEEYDVALQRLEEASQRLREASWRVLYNVGMAAARLGNIEKAKVSLRKAIELNSQAVEPKLFFANILCDEQNYSAAREILVNAFGGFSPTLDGNVRQSEDDKGIPLVTLAPMSTKRRQLITNRMVRDSALVRELKALYNDTCQICGIRIVIGPDRYYSEVHHIHPLGVKHDGPDTKSNAVVLCPNHHTAFDYGCIAIHPDTQDVYEYQNGHVLKTGPLLRALGHDISPECLKYYVKNIFLGRLE